MGDPLAPHLLGQLLCFLLDVSPPFSPCGPHSNHCPFKKEEILLINKRPNLSAKPAAGPAGSPEIRVTFRHRICPRLNLGIRCGDPSSLQFFATPGLRSDGLAEPGGGT